MRSPIAPIIIANSVTLSNGRYNCTKGFVVVACEIVVVSLVVVNPVVSGIVVVNLVVVTGFVVRVMV